MVVRDPYYAPFGETSDAPAPNPRSKKAENLLVLFAERDIPSHPHTPPISQALLERIWDFLR